MVFILHDLSVVRFFSDDVALVYLGCVMEFGTAEAIYAPPCCPRTEALLLAVPIPHLFRGEHVPPGALLAVHLRAVATSYFADALAAETIHGNRTEPPDSMKLPSATSIPALPVPCTRSGRWYCV
jgi:ABC-type dipeptide/oligopeptide/nickel transport system ATPase component